MLFGLFAQRKTKNLNAKNVLCGKAMVSLGLNVRFFVGRNQFDNQI